MEYRIEDLIDIPLFQVLQDRLNEIYSFPSAIIDNEGKVLTATAWQDVCTKFHRANPECAAECRKSDLYILEHLAEARPAVTYRCPHGLVDNATPIVIGGKHLANYFTGQFFLEPPDLDVFRAQARRYGFDEGAYVEAVRKVPIWSQRKLDQYLDFIKGFTEILCGIGLKHLRGLEARQVIAENRSALEEMSVFNQQLVESVQEGVVVFGRDLRYQLWNPYMERLTGMRAEEVLGKHPLDVFPVVADTGALERVEEALQGRVAPTIELPYRLADGRSGWTSNSCAPLRSKDGGIAGAIAIVRDVTAERRAEEDRQRLRTQLAQAQRLESIGRLAGGIAHDFNNMLSVVFSNLDIVMEQLGESSPLRADLVEVRQVAERSANLTRQLMAFARRQPAAPKVVDLNDAVASTLTMIRRLVGENIEVAWQPAPEPAVVSIDPSQLDQILANLCVNARDAIPGVGRVTIETRNVALDAANDLRLPEAGEGEWVLLSIRDTGAGMARDVKDQVFEPFFTTKAQSGGTGLGLPTVYGIVRQNDGVIHVDSEPGRGTSFDIYLPRRTLPSLAGTGAGTGPAATDATARRSMSGAETVLLVEDDGAVRRVVSRVLQRLGYRILVASAPGEALRIAREHPGAIHLLVTDVVMPEMDGVELAGQLSRTRPDMRLLFTSGYPAQLTTERGTLPEGVIFLPKPFLPDQLAEKVREALGGAGRVRPLRADRRAGSS